jgi:hypothetical protein
MSTLRQMSRAASFPSGLGCIGAGLVVALAVPSHADHGWYGVSFGIFSVLTVVGRRIKRKLDL